MQIEVTDDELEFIKLCVNRVAQEGFYDFPLGIYHTEQLALQFFSKFKTISYQEMKWILDKGYYDG